MWAGRGSRARPRGKREGLAAAGGLAMRVLAVAGFAAAGGCDSSQGLAVELQPRACGVVTGVDVDEVGAVGALVGEHGDGGGVDIGDRASVGVFHQFGSDAGGGHRKPPVHKPGHGPAGPGRHRVPAGPAGQTWAARSMARRAWASRSAAMSASSTVWETLVTACMTPPAVSCPPRMKWARIESAMSSLNLAAFATCRTVSSGRVTGAPAFRSISVTLACR